MTTGALKILRCASACVVSTKNTSGIGEILALGDLRDSTYGGYVTFSASATVILCSNVRIECLGRAGIASASEERSKCSLMVSMPGADAGSQPC